MPKDIADFPPIVHHALSLYNRLGDRFASTDLGLLYIGKELTALPVLFSYSDILETDRSFVLELIQYFDSRAIKQSSKRLENAAKKLKNKTRK